MISTAEIDAQVAELLQGVADGEDLDDQQVILVNYALHAGSGALDPGGAESWQQRALINGITAEQLQEVVTLMSALGVHAFFITAPSLAAAAAPNDGWGELDAERQLLWDRYIGERGYWDAMQSEIPGFLESLLRLSPDVFEAFIRYVGIPFRTQMVAHVTKELISMAADGCPAHQYLPGLRMHLRNAIFAGAGRKAIEHTMRIAAESPAHVGVA